MKKTINLEAETLRVLSAFYRNDMAFFSRRTCEQILFDIPGYGPCELTPLSIRTLSFFEDPRIRHAVRKTCEPLISQSSRVCSILMNFTLESYRQELPVCQNSYRLFISWCNLSCQLDNPEWKVTIFRIAECRDWPVISGAGLLSEASAPMPRDSIVSEGFSSYSVPRRNLVAIKDRSHAIHYLDIDDIIWAESDHMHSIVHAHSGTFSSISTLTQLANDSLSCLYRPHISYLINPKYLHRISHMQLTLIDGTVIPVPERRFPQVKKDLMRPSAPAVSMA